MAATESFLTPKRNLNSRFESENNVFVSPDPDLLGRPQFDSSERVVIFPQGRGFGRGGFNPNINPNQRVNSPARSVERGRGGRGRARGGRGGGRGVAEDPADDESCSDSEEEASRNIPSSMNALHAFSENMISNRLAENTKKGYISRINQIVTWLKKSPRHISQINSYVNC